MNNVFECSVVKDAILVKRGDAKIVLLKKEKIESILSKTDIFGRLKIESIANLFEDILNENKENAYKILKISFECDGLEKWIILIQKELVVSLKKKSLNKKKKSEKGVCNARIKPTKR